MGAACQPCVYGGCSWLCKTQRASPAVKTQVGAGSSTSTAWELPPGACWKGSGAFVRSGFSSWCVWVMPLSERQPDFCGHSIASRVHSSFTGNALSPVTSTAVGYVCSMGNCCFSSSLFQAMKAHTPRFGRCVRILCHFCKKQATTSVYRPGKEAELCFCTVTAVSKFILRRDGKKTHQKEKKKRAFAVAAGGWELPPASAGQLESRLSIR